MKKLGILFFSVTFLVIFACSSKGVTPTNTPFDPPSFTDSPMLPVTSEVLPFPSETKNFPTIPPTKPPTSTIAPHLLITPVSVRQLLPENGAIFKSGYVQVVLRWEEVPDAIKYELETLSLLPGQNCWWERGDLVQHWFNQQYLETTEIIIDHYGENPHCWRVRAIYSESIIGPYSDWRIIYFK